MKYFVTRVTNHPDKVVVAKRIEPHDSAEIIMKLNDNPENEAVCQKMADSLNGIGE